MLDTHRAPADARAFAPHNALSVAQARPGRQSQPLPQTPVAAPAEPNEYRRIVRALMAEAMQTLLNISAKGLFPARLKSGHPEVVRLVCECTLDKPRNKRPVPSPRAIDRMDALLPLLMHLPEEERVAVSGVALGMSLRRLGGVLGISHETVRVRERDGIDSLVVMLARQQARL